MALGSTLLALARVSAYLTGVYMANAKLIPSRYKECCPFCEDDAADSLCHVLLHCDAWANERERFLVPGILQGVQGSCDVSSCVQMLGGVSREGFSVANWAGKAATRATNKQEAEKSDDGEDDNDADDDVVHWFRDELPERDAASVGAGCKGQPESTGMYRGDIAGMPPFVGVALFLQSIHTRRCKRFGALAQRAEAPPGMADLNTSDGGTSDSADSSGSDFS